MQSSIVEENSSQSLLLRMTYQIDGEKYECVAKLDKTLKTFSPDDIQIESIGLFQDIQIQADEVDNQQFIQETKGIVFHFFIDSFNKDEMSEIIADISERCALDRYPIRK